MATYGWLRLAGLREWEAPQGSSLLQTRCLPSWYQDGDVSVANAGQGLVSHLL